MRIILTHEQADFDAVAAVIGAALLQEGDLPILPRRMNRNVHSFLNLYADDLPFVDFRDLPVEPIDRITLVDTQALVTLKGTTGSTKIQVIDHHQLKEHMDPAWQVRIEKVGAVTTLLVESIQAANLSLSPVQATLLLLGIYEDTGSLAYASTTARDVRCAAFLLEQGASLKMASTYLNPPLSLEQRGLYEKLLANAVSHDIHNLHLVTSSASALGMQEEVSTIAHKIRDLLEPDGLFILVATDEGYRLVMRSTSDKINVASIAAHFGGGGHERAAAALIQRKSDEKADPSIRLDEIMAELVELLPGHVKPTITVGQIMSHRPRLIHPDISASDASLLMQRYGYEGFPVVDQQQVLGLLTRRAVDRALAHKLNLKAASLMDAGHVQVAPHDSLEHLQRIMTESGWGQIPVFDDHKNEIVGIVTRTDLLKILGTSQENRRQRSLALRLDGSLPPGRLKLLKTIAQVATDSHMAAYIVGGFVRDLILGHPSLDFDIVVEGDAISLANRLCSQFGGRMVAHSRFGTAKWYLSDVHQTILDQFGIPNLPGSKDLPESLDLITARTEFYDHPTALPTVERSSIKLDLHRRDFSINTLAIRLDGRHYGELLDYWGGYTDLQRGQVRVLHSLSFIDDPTRMLRAVRFEQRFKFRIEQRTLDLMREAVDQLHAITGERIRHEFDLILEEDRPSLVLERLQELNLLSSIQPFLVWDEDWSADLDRLLKESQMGLNPVPYADGHDHLRITLGYAFWWMHLPEEVVRTLVKRLHLSAQLERAVMQAGQLWSKVNLLTGMRPSEIVDMLEPCTPVVLSVVSAGVHAPEIQSILDEYQQVWMNIKPTIDGNTIQKMGLSPGPEYRVVLKEVKHAWLDGVIHNQEEERLYLSKLLEKK
jgi:tRNA nucleotidyltransferase (CCA-adding enzyme)